MAEVDDADDDDEAVAKAPKASIRTKSLRPRKKAKAAVQPEDDDSATDDDVGSETGQQGDAYDGDPEEEGD